MNNPVIDVRKELEALRDALRDTRDISGSSPYRHHADRIDALLQRIPDGWEMRPRDPSIVVTDIGSEWVDSVKLKCPPVKERICTRCGRRERREWP